MKAVWCTALLLKYGIFGSARFAEYLLRASRLISSTSVGLTIASTEDESLLTLIISFANFVVIVAVCQRERPRDDHLFYTSGELQSRLGMSYHTLPEQGLQELVLGFRAEYTVSQLRNRSNHNLLRELQLTDVKQ